MLTKRINEYAHYSYDKSPASCGSLDIQEIRLDIPVHLENHANYYCIQEKYAEQIIPKLQQYKHAIQQLTITQNICSGAGGWTITIDENIDVYGCPSKNKASKKQNKIIKQYNHLRKIFLEEAQKRNHFHNKEKLKTLPYIKPNFSNFNNASKNKVDPLVDICFAITPYNYIIKYATSEIFFKTFKKLQRIYEIATSEK